MEKFCVRCGNTLVNGVCPRCSQQQKQNYQNNQQYQQSRQYQQSQQNQQQGYQNQQHSQQNQQQNQQQYSGQPVSSNTYGQTEEKFRSLLVDSREKIVACLGNSYLQSFLGNGGLKKGFAVVSDKRVYFQGTSFDVRGGSKASRTEMSRIVDLQDITGTGFNRYSNVSTLIASILLIGAAFILGITFSSYGVGGIYSMGWMPFMNFVVGVVGLLVYFCFKKTFFIIEFSGGAIAFDVRWFSKNEIEVFQKQLCIAKDKAVANRESKFVSQIQQSLMGR